MFNKKKGFTPTPMHIGMGPAKAGRGFTLIELLVVISIIGLLSSVVLISLNDARAKARDAHRIQSLKEVQKALILYYAEYGRYPDDITGNTYGTDCWECETNAEVAYDVNKQIALQPYLDPRPSDPSVPIGGQFPVDTSDAKGYYYKTDSSGQDYKIGIVGTLEGNIPRAMRDVRFHWSIENSITLYSENASSWGILTIVN